MLTKSLISGVLALVIIVPATAATKAVDPIVAKYLSMGKGQAYATCMWRGVSGNNSTHTKYSEDITVSYCNHYCGDSFCNQGVGGK